LRRSKWKENFVRRIAARELTEEDAGIVLEDIVAERLLFPVPKADSVVSRAAEVNDETEDDESASRGQRAGGVNGKQGGATHPVSVTTFTKDIQNSSSPNTRMPSRLSPIMHTR
jgi:hypothetical protein